MEDLIYFLKCVGLGTLILAVIAGMIFILFYYTNIAVIILGVIAFLIVSFGIGAFLLNYSDDLDDGY